MIRRLLLVPAFLLCVLLIEGTGCSPTGSVGLNNDGGNVDAGPDGGDGGDGGRTSDGGTIETGPGDFHLDGGGGGSGSGVTFGPDGGLVLSSNDVNLHYAWIANSSAGTVSKFDTDTGNEVARYYSVIPIDGLGSPNALQAGGQNSPSRTALDLAGNVWIANRAPGLQGSATKIANTLDQCRPLADGGYLTSRDLNGNGRIDTDPDAGEFIRPSNPSDPTQYDSCILFSTPLGSPGGSGVKGRALAVSQGSVEGGSTDGIIWFGNHADQTVYKLNANNGQPMPVTDGGALTIPLPWGPYGAAVDSQQRLWLVAATLPHLALVDTRTSTLINGDIVPDAGLGITGAYGIAVDGRDRVWLASWTNGPTVSRYDHGPGLDAGVGTWTKFDFSSAVSQTGSSLGFTRGIACDDQNICWASGHQSLAGAQVAQLIGFNADDGGTYTFNLPGGGRADFIDATNAGTDSITSIGVGLDRSNNIWVNNFGNVTGDAMRINRDGGAVFYTQTQLGNLYTYSDFTGYQLRHFTAPQGRFSRVFTGCGTGTVWGPVSWSATLPPNTSVTLYVKAGDNLATLESTPQYGPFSASPADLQAAGVPRRSYLQVMFILNSTDRRSTPTLYQFSVSMQCPQIPG